MLRYQNLPNNAGIILCGDYTTLDDLHTVVHTIVGQSTLRLKDPKNYLMAFAYDVRKAMEKQRETIKPPEHFPEIGVMFGVKMLWPLLLIQVKMLRFKLAFMPSNKRAHAMVFALEDLVESALTNIFPDESGEILRAYERLQLDTEEKIDRVWSRCAQFTQWKRSQRKNGLAELLLSFEFMYDHSIYPRRLEAGMKLPFVLEKMNAMVNESDWIDW